MSVSCVIYMQVTSEDERYTDLYRDTEFGGLLKIK